MYQLSLTSARILPRPHAREHSQTLHHLVSRDSPQVSTSLPDNWTYQGCFSDSVASRTLAAATDIDPTALTEESCIAFCASAGYIYAGVEYTQECCACLSLPCVSKRPDLERLQIATTL